MLHQHAYLREPFDIPQRASIACCTWTLVTLETYVSAESLTKLKKAKAIFTTAVPQPDNWLQAFRAARQSLSSRTAANLSFTDQFITSSRVDVQAVRRRAFQQMHNCMQKALSALKRALFREATSVALSVDDKKQYRLVRLV